MLIELLLEVIYKLFNLLTSPISIPKLPTELASAIDTVFEYIISGVQILGNYVNLQFILVLFGIVLAVDIGIKIYHFVMWIIRKIPFTGIT